MGMASGAAAYLNQRSIKQPGGIAKIKRRHGGAA